MCLALSSLYVARQKRGIRFCPDPQALGTALLRAAGMEGASKVDPWARRLGQLSGKELQPVSVSSEASTPLPPPTPTPGSYGGQDWPAPAALNSPGRHFLHMLFRLPK